MSPYRRFPRQRRCARRHPSHIGAVAAGKIFGDLPDVRVAVAIAVDERLRLKRQSDGQ